MNSWQLHHRSCRPHGCSTLTPAFDYGCSKQPGSGCSTRTSPGVSSFPANLHTRATTTARFSTPAHSTAEAWRHRRRLSHLFVIVPNPHTCRPPHHRQSPEPKAPCPGSTRTSTNTAYSNSKRTPSKTSSSGTAAALTQQGRRFSQARVVGFFVKSAHSSFKHGLVGGGLSPRGWAGHGVGWAISQRAHLGPNPTFGFLINFVNWA